MIRNRLLWLVSMLLTLGMLSACHEKNDVVEVVEEPDSSHTLLIYMIGDNSLSRYCEQNTKSSIKGLLESPKPLNLLIYEDSYKSGDEKKGTPVLFRLKRNAVDKHKMDTIYLKKYDEDWDSTNTDVMLQVMTDAFGQYNTEVKGLELWSHGMGWVPSGVVETYLSRPSAEDEPATRASQWIGEDHGVHMDIWTLRETLEKLPHLDYISFDACHMGQAEVAYELRGVADYMMGCPTEILEAGLPYQAMMRSLSTCQDKSSLRNALKMVVDDFADFYDGVGKGGEGTFGLTDLREMEEVRAAYKGLRETYADRVQLLDEHCYTYEGYITHYGRSTMGARFYFYDLLDAARFFAGADTLGTSFAQLEAALNKAVVKEYHTSSFLGISPIRGCGLGVALPEMFQASNNPRSLRAGYAKVQWEQ